MLSVVPSVFAIHSRVVGVSADETKPAQGWVIVVNTLTSKAADCVLITSSTLNLHYRRWVRLLTA